MMSLLIIRENILSYIRQHERIVLPIVRFFYTLIVMLSFKTLFGYQDSLYRWPVLLGLAVVGAFLPGGLTYLIVMLFICIDLATFSVEAAGLLLAGMLISYFLYLRVMPGKSWIILVTMVLAMKLPGLVPFLIVILIGPMGIIPAVCGIILYYYSVHCKDLYNVLMTASGEKDVNAIAYLINQLSQDRQMLLYLAICVVVMLVTYFIYQSSMVYAWMISIMVGMVVLILGFLAGGIIIDDPVSFRVIFLGSVLSGLAAMLVQFFKGIVDYSRIEVVQFEDDEYYYYVKAVPKIRITKQDLNVKKINVRNRNRSNK